MIDAQNLSKTFLVHRKEPGLMGSLRSLVMRKKEPRHAVRGVSLHVSEGEIVGVLGANGAGKTTLVKMLTGIIHPTSGTASVLGHEPWKRHDEFRRRIALIMGQKAQLWWDLPAADCFLLLKEIYRLPEKTYTANLERLAEVLGVRELLNTQIRRLSLGERMKMELIAALLHDPQVIFLDEPTIGLDFNAQHAIREFLLEYQQERRPAVILTSHYMEDIERLCRRIVIMREGRVVYDGGLAEVVQRYAPEKIVTVHLSEDAYGKREAAERMATVREWSHEAAVMAVPRENVAKAAAQLMELLPVADLSIEEPDVSAIIANIMTARGEEEPQE